MEREFDDDALAPPALIAVMAERLGDDSHRKKVGKECGCGGVFFSSRGKSSVQQTERLQTWKVKRAHMNQMIYNDMTGNSRGRWVSPPRASARNQGGRHKKGEPRFQGRRNPGGRESRGVVVRRHSPFSQASPEMQRHLRTFSADNALCLTAEGTPSETPAASPPRARHLASRNEAVAERRVVGLIKALEAEKRSAVAAEDYFRAAELKAQVDAALANEEQRKVINSPPLGTLVAPPPPPPAPLDPLGSSLDGPSLQSKSMSTSTLTTRESLTAATSSLSSRQGSRLRSNSRSTRTTGTSSSTMTGSSNTGGRREGISATRTSAPPRAARPRNKQPISRSGASVSRLGSVPSMAL